MALSAVVACACSLSEIESAVGRPSLTLFDEDAAVSDSSCVYATLPKTKTEIGEDGATILWKEGDQICICTNRSGTLCYYIYTLASGADTPNGTFSGLKLRGTIVGAFYPAIGTPEQVDAELTGHTRFVFNLPTIQEQVPDFKVAASYTKDEDNIYTFDFRQKMTLLEFVITPTQEIAAGTLTEVLLTSPRKLSNGFVMDIEQAEDPLIPREDASNLAEFRFAGGTAAALSADGAYHVRMIVFPTIKKSDALTIVLKTPEKTYSAKLTSAKDYLPGYRYRMTLDLPELAEAGILREESGSRYLAEQTQFGIYDLKGLSPVLLLDKDWQAGYSSSTFRLQNWDEGRAVRISHPDNMTLGNEYSLGVSYVGEHSPELPSTLDARLTKVDASSGKMWLEDPLNDLGFIIGQ